MTRILNIAEVDQVLDCEVIAKSPHAFKVGTLVGELLDRRARDEHPEPSPSYPDDVVAVMRDTIDSLREAIKAKDALIILLRHEVDETRRTLEEGTASLQLAQAIIAANQARLAGSPLPEGM